MTIDIGSTGTAGTTLRAAYTGDRAQYPSGASVTLGADTIVDQATPNSLAIIDSQSPQHDALIVLGTINAEAPGGTFEVTGDLILGGTLNVSNGNRVLAAGTLAPPGSSGPGIYMAGTAAVLNVDSLPSVVVDSRFDFVGTANFMPGAEVVVEPGTMSVSEGMINGSLTDNGTILSFYHDLTINGNLNGTGTLCAAGLGTLAVNGSVGGVTLGFDPNSLKDGPIEIVVAQPSSISGPIQNFSSGTTIDLQGFFLTGWSYAGTVLTLSNASGNIVVDTDSTYGDQQIQVVGDAVSGDTTATITGGPLACFAAGTRIATPHGDAAVETLRLGDVVVLASGGVAPMLWIGHRRIDCRKHPNARRVWPVRIGVDAFGPGRPRRDLFLSPNHAVFVEDVLIPVKYLINDVTIAQVQRGSVTYYQVELESHSVLQAEGLSVESYLDTGDRSSFLGGDGPIALYPDFTSLQWESEGCAPLVVTGPKLEAAQCWINALAVTAVAKARVRFG